MAPAAGNAAELKSAAAKIDNAPSNAPRNAPVQNNTAAQTDDTSQTNAAQAAAAPTGASDATAQSIMASAIQSSGTNISNPSGAVHDATTPDPGTTPQDAASVNAAPTAVAVAALASRPAAATAAAAARVASNAQLIPDLAGASATDRRAHIGAADLSAATSIDASAGAAQAVVSASASDLAPSPALNVTARVDSPEFGQAVADRVSLMVDSNLTNAKLQVNPPALGPIEVKIALQAGHAQVWLTSHSAVTRDALESSSPKLKEMLGAQGFGQVSVDISQRSFQDRTPQPRGYEASALDGSAAGGAAPPVAISASRAASGLLDAYA
jgi:flagellar hook-length control protein FliK